MRRNAWRLLAISVGFAMGCGPAIPFRDLEANHMDPAAISTGGDSSEDSASRFSRGAVPDSVMLREQANAGYQDSPGPPF